MQCSQCRCEVTPGKKFCKHCGAHITALPDASSISQTPAPVRRLTHSRYFLKPKPSWSTVWSVSLLVAMAAALGIGIWFAFSNEKPVSSSQPSTNILVPPVVPPLSPSVPEEPKLETEQEVQPTFAPDAPYEARFQNQSVSALEKRGEEILSRLKDTSTESETDWEEAVHLYHWLNDKKPDGKYQSREYFVQARLAFLRNDFRSAISGYEQAMALDDSWALPVNGLGRVYVSLGDKKRGREYYLRATQIEPKWIYPWINLGTISLILKDYEAAESALHQAIVLNPKKASVHYYLGQALEKLNRPCEAVAEYNLAIEYARNSASSGFNPGQLRNLANGITEKYGCFDGE